MDGFFEKGSGSGGGEAEGGWEGGVVARQSGATEGAEGRAGAALDRLPGQMPWVLGGKGRSDPLGAAATPPALGCSLPAEPRWPGGALLTPPCSKLIL